MYTSVHKYRKFAYQNPLFTCLFQIMHDIIYIICIYMHTYAYPLYLCTYDIHRINTAYSLLYDQIYNIFRTDVLSLVLSVITPRFPNLFFTFGDVLPSFLLKTKRTRTEIQLDSI